MPVAARVAKTNATAVQIAAAAVAASQKSSSSNSSNRTKCKQKAQTLRRLSWRSKRSKAPAQAQTQARTARMKAQKRKQQQGPASHRCCLCHPASAEMAACCKCTAPVTSWSGTMPMLVVSHPLLPQVRASRMMRALVAWTHLTPRCHQHSVSPKLQTAPRSSVRAACPAPRRLLPHRLRL